MGTFRIYDEDDNLLGEFKNKFVNSGKQFMLDFAFNSTSWISGNWYGNRYIAVGDSTNTNAGVVGPTTGTALSVTGQDWHGASPSDWRLTHEITGTDGRAQLVCERVGNVCMFNGYISDDNVNHSVYGDPIYIYEFGIFLTSGYNVPTADPTDPLNTTHRKDAMIVRATSTWDDTVDIYAQPIPKASGKRLRIQYTFADFEGAS